MYGCDSKDTNKNHDSQAEGNTDKDRRKTEVLDRKDKKERVKGKQQMLPPKITYSKDITKNSGRNSERHV